MASPPDDLAPFLWRWTSVRSFDVRAESPRVLTTKLWLSDSHSTTELRFGGEPDLVKPIRETIDRYRLAARSMEMA